MADQRQARAGSGGQANGAKAAAGKSRAGQAAGKAPRGATAARQVPSGQVQPGTTPAGRAAAGSRAAAAGLPDAPRWLWLSTLILSVAGLGVSIYLTIEHFTSNTLAGCAENATINCTKVTTSAQSVVFGIFPVAVLGLAFYVFMVAVNSPWGWRWKLPAVRWVRLASVVVGIAFVLYLVYAELFQIQAICLYCTSVHVITFLLFAIIVFDTTFRTAPASPPARGR